MAMTLRLTEDENQALRTQTEAEHRSMQEVVTAVTSLREAGTDVVSVVTAVDPVTGVREAIKAAGLPYRMVLQMSELPVSGGASRGRSRLLR